MLYRQLLMGARKSYSLAYELAIFSSFVKVFLQEGVRSFSLFGAGFLTLLGFSSCSQLEVIWVRY
ncbi:hypothetical protein DSO57_1007714 [Entomophthora muscae]|uniref:Uncharacterized protein n=1 Tax=Entomophthora muscae TaxID=34485 RepID=A0ACC2SWL6_9FUNG|nr:hypothetical protein DSO57_1007714 [Entomophthora muscae]